MARDCGYPPWLSTDWIPNGSKWSQWRSVGFKAELQFDVYIYSAEILEIPRRWSFVQASASVWLRVGFDLGPVLQPVELTSRFQQWKTPGHQVQAIPTVYKKLQKYPRKIYGWKSFVGTIGPQISVLSASLGV